MIATGAPGVSRGWATQRRAAREREAKRSLGLLRILSSGWSRVQCLPAQGVTRPTIFQVRLCLERPGATLDRSAADRCQLDCLRSRPRYVARWVVDAEGTLTGS